MKYVLLVILLVSCQGGFTYSVTRGGKTFSVDDCQTSLGELYYRIGNVKHNVLAGSETGLECTVTRI